MNNNLIGATFVCVSLILVSCSDDSRIGTELDYLPSFVEMQRDGMPDIGHFYHIQLFTKRDDDLLKWKLQLSPTRYNKKLSKILVEAELDDLLTPPNIPNPDAENGLWMSESATKFTIKFVDSDGFLIAEDLAGRKIVHRLTDGETTTTETGTEHFISQFDPSGEILYFGNLKMESSDIDKIDHARIFCFIKKDLEATLRSIIQSEEAAENQED